MDSDKQKQINDIIFYFNKQINIIFKFIDSKDDDVKNNETIDHARRLVKIVRREYPALMLERCIDKLWDNKEAIINKDAQFFMGSDVMHKYIKDDSNKEWLTGLIEFIKEQYDVFTKEELDKLWVCINRMLECVIKYRLLMEI